MEEKKKMKKGMQTGSPKVNDQNSIIKKETMVEGKLDLPQQKTSLKQVRDTIRKLKALETEGRLIIYTNFSDFLGKQVVVDSMGMCVRFDLGAMKVLEEAQERRLLYGMSAYRFSGFAGGWIESIRRGKATEEQKKRMDEKNAVFLKFFQELASR